MYCTQARLLDFEEKSLFITLLLPTTGIVINKMLWVYWNYKLKSFIHTIANFRMIMLATVQGANSAHITSM